MDEQEQQQNQANDENRQGDHLAERIETLLPLNRLDDLQQAGHRLFCGKPFGILPWLLLFSPHSLPLLWT
jgi:hypothetical protein